MRAQTLPGSKDEDPLRSLNAPEVLALMAGLTQAPEGVRQDLFAASMSADF